MAINYPTALFIIMDTRPIHTWLKNHGKDIIAISNPMNRAIGFFDLDTSECIHFRIDHVRNDKALCKTYNRIRKNKVPKGDMFRNLLSMLTVDKHYAVQENR